VPDLLHRKHYEKVSTSALSRLQAEQRRRIENLINTGREPDSGYWDRNEAELKSALFLLMQPVFEVSANTLYSTSFQETRNAANEWADAQSTAMAHDINATSQRLYEQLVGEKRRHQLVLLAGGALATLGAGLVGQRLFSTRPYLFPQEGLLVGVPEAPANSLVGAVGRTLPASPVPGGSPVIDLYGGRRATAEALDRIFGLRRAGSIAVTSITQAQSAGQVWAIDQQMGDKGRFHWKHELERVRRNVQGPQKRFDFAEEPPELLGALARAVWRTAMDDRVCKICRPLDNQPGTVWTASFPAGPPAHINCRCYLDFDPTNEEPNEFNVSF